MAATVRLYRIGKKGKPAYRIVVVNKRYKSNGNYIEEVGKYNPMVEPALFRLNKAGSTIGLYLPTSSI